jgi:gluconokinase
MGVSGAGKTTAGQALAAHLGVPFCDADDLHPAANVAKMRAGVALDDADRAPWLDAVGTWLADHSGGAVMSCSALRLAYRDTLRRHAAAVRFLHLAGDPAVVRERVASRAGHYMPASLVESQYAALEPLGDEEEGLTVDFDEPIDAIVVRAATAALGPAARSASAA